MAERTRSERRGREAGPQNRPTKGVSGRAAERARARERRRGPTPKGGRSADVNARYTAPIPAAKRHSPPWYPWVVLGLLIVGVATIILNFVQALPASPTNWYTLGGIVAILAGTLLATGYR